MREIKFRGKCLDNEWVYGDYHRRAGGVHCIIDMQPDFQGKVEYVVIQVDSETVGQFTGLHDKNGREIYEGDILRGDEYPYNCDGVDNYFVEIVWADNLCAFYRITHKKPNSTVRGISSGNWSELDEDDIKSFEVIGNIHDNPELLNTE